MIYFLRCLFLNKYQFADLPQGHSPLHSTITSGAFSSIQLTSLRTHALKYVLPSLPHTGSYFFLILSHDGHLQQTKYMTIKIKHSKNKT